jgi:alpha/beta superfamily hydrolase
MPSRDEQEFTLPESGSKALIADCQSALAVIVTHPWGPLGGNMNNNIVLGICLWFQRLKITTMRFDFCGSQIGRGYRQVQQVEEAAKFLLGEEHLSPQKKLDDDVIVPKYILLVGYSYGSIISASASSSIPTCIGVVCIAPPLAVRHWLYVFHGNYHLEQAKKRQVLRLMVIGSEDNFTSEKIFQEVVKTFPEESTTGAVLKGADHFFQRREKDLMDILGKKSTVDEWQGCYGMNDCPDIVFLYSLLSFLFTFRARSMDCERISTMQW